MPCGSFDGPVIKLAGLEAWPDISGTLYLPDYKSLLVADLHFEKGSSQAHRGVHLPPYDTRNTLAGLNAAIHRFQPQRLICLGDSFHDGAAGVRLEDEDLATIRALSDTTEVYWLTGNHDPDVAGNIGGHIADELVLGPVTLRHIPQAGAVNEIAGHLHPVASVHRRGRRLRRKCFVSDGLRLILPAFGAYTGGLSVWAAPFQNLFGNGTFSAWMLGRKTVHRVASRSLIKQTK